MYVNMYLFNKEIYICMLKEEVLREDR